MPEAADFVNRVVSPLPSFPRSAWERTPHRSAVQGNAGRGRSYSLLTDGSGATQSVADLRSHAERGNEGNGEGLRDQLFDDPAVDVRQPEVAAGVAVGELGVVEPQQVPHRRGQV